jgi:hypothetical protein
VGVVEFWWVVDRKDRKYPQIPGFEHIVPRRRISYFFKCVCVLLLMKID